MHIYFAKGSQPAGHSQSSDDDHRRKMSATRLWSIGGQADCQCGNGADFFHGRRNAAISSIRQQDVFVLG